MLGGGELACLLLAIMFAACSVYAEPLALSSLAAQGMGTSNCTHGTVWWDLRAGEPERTMLQHFLSAVAGSDTRCPSQTLSALDTYRGTEGDLLRVGFFPNSLLTLHQEEGAAPCIFYSPELCLPGFLGQLTSPVWLNLTWASHL